MCENDGNDTIMMIKNKFDEIFSNQYGTIENIKVELKVDSSQLGQLMIGFENLSINEKEKNYQNHEFYTS